MTEGKIEPPLMTLKRLLMVGGECNNPLSLWAASHLHIYMHSHMHHEIASFFGSIAKISAKAR